MIVYKFGGASVRDANAVRNVVQILANHTVPEKVVVVSAMGKTTNALESILHRYIASEDTWQSELDALRDSHLQIIKDLSDIDTIAASKAVTDLIERLREFLLHNESDNYNFLYDQVVSLGEYLSTTIVSHYCLAQGLPHTLLDAKRCIHTDQAYTEGRIDWRKTERAIIDTIPLLTATGFVITQGFIGCTPEKFTTTLGREGSDYTAAIFAYCLNAERMVVWKDVAGIMNADPKEYPDAQRISDLTYLEAIEMTYYGASVIHPKTIKPLQNRNIPMEVRSFINPTLPGSLISANANMSFLPPIIIHKRDQTLLSFSARDFSFIAEDHLTKVFAVLATHRLRINLMQNAAISFSICIDTKREKITQVIEELQADFGILSNEQLSILTIRHYHEGIIEKLTQGRDILLRQASRHTIQVLMRE